MIITDATMMKHMSDPIDFETDPSSPLIVTGGAGPSRFIITLRSDHRVLFDFQGAHWEGVNRIVVPMRGDVTDIDHYPSLLADLRFSNMTPDLFDAEGMLFTGWLLRGYWYDEGDIDPETHEFGYDDNPDVTRRYCPDEGHMNHILAPHEPPRKRIYPAAVTVRVVEERPTVRSPFVHY